VLLHGSGQAMLRVEWVDRAGRADAMERRDSL
jgi:hypothetical protein